MARQGGPGTVAMTTVLQGVGDTGTGLSLEADSYAFFQLLRLLRRMQGDEAAFHAGVRVRPTLSLAFPETDVQSARRDEDGQWQVEANFFGLYGVTSPLPTFYTEDLIDEAMQGQSSMRDFLDILHAALYPLLYRAWEKYRLWLQIDEQGDMARLDQLFALVGLQARPQQAPMARALLPYAGLFGQRPRSALGLESLLGQLLKGAPVRVEPCAERAVAIPHVAQCRLGAQAHVLGECAVLGQRVRDRAGNLLIVVGPVTADAFMDLLPGAAGFERIRQTLAHYLEAPLRCMLHLLIVPGQRRAATLGQGWSRLGEQTWLGGPATGWDRLPLRAVRFPLTRN